ncbi:FKBP-type peptidyl-prolyl cis-trans isomerase [Steroidobacter sp. S1-65]|uniref:Peptidyl-prolyl cis-trans isomerase n=1 Tax=Steroidobacter gossypii TaxID=2805490 RepID=A0ABS1X310_9GAMM|nr:FKBP-type peptidyl-prolyl cis-trans isomerase [Steroidobacter gossypii]MBM0107614.1 FKBP-type peptidyl-prolyl cis-trans isomerase [Steroidobacter gossypii]
MNKLSIICVSVAAALLAAACGNDAPSTARRPAASAAPAITELQKIDIVKGTGEGISSGQQAVVHYTGWLYEPGAPDHKGMQFDSSRTSGRPFRFTIGAGGVIKGWEEGVQGMQPGGQRQLIIPPELGYGATGAGGGQIPPNATLLFDIELLAIEDAPAP